MFYIIVVFDIKSTRGRMAELSKALLSIRTISLQLFAVRALPSTYILSLTFHPLQNFFFFQFQGGQWFKSRPERPIFQQPSAAMPPMSGGLYGGPEYPQGGGEWRKVAEIGLN